MANPTPSPVGNPFTPGRVVPPERFVGRTALLSDLYAHLATGGSVSLVGDARIGKSSLLRYLHHTLPTHLPPPCVSIPLVMSDFPTPDAFGRAVLEPLLPHLVPPPGGEARLRAVETQLERGDPIPFDTCARLLDWAAEGGVRVVLLLDEFKEMLERPAAFDDPFRSRLRTLYTEGRLALVMATRQPITEIPGLTAYFANGVIQKHLGPLLPSEAEALLRQPHDRPFPDELVRLGVEEGRNHPLRLQLVGSQLYQWGGVQPHPLYAGVPLHPNARAMLHQAVEPDYQQMLEASRPPRPPHAGVGSWLGRLGRGAGKMGSQVADLQDKMMGVVIVVVLVVVLLFVLGLIAPEQMTPILCAVRGGCEP